MEVLNEEEKLVKKILSHEFIINDEEKDDAQNEIKYLRKLFSDRHIDVTNKLL